MRTFIAIELPKEIKDYLSRLQGQLKTSGADVKWVEPQNIHLTLKFLGEIEEKKITAIAEIMEGVCAAENTFSVRLSSVGAFPRPSTPRVIWVGIDKGDKETKRIAQNLEEKIVQLDIPKEDRDFSSHITIGRTRSGLNIGKLANSLTAIADKPAKDNLEFYVKKIVLFKSTLTPKGPVYEVLNEASLKTI